MLAKKLELSAEDACELLAATLAQDGHVTQAMVALAWNTTKKYLVGSTAEEKLIGNTAAVADLQKLR